MLNTKHIRQRFERAADRFDEADFVHATTREGLLSRLDPLLIEAKTVIDLGAATGTANRSLAKRFRAAHVILPFPDESIDVIFSNLLLPWVSEPERVFSEIARVLRKGGVFAFATLGPDSLQEIARAWSQVDGGVHVHRFPDMHDLGDGMVTAGLSDPVLDVDRLSVSYTNADRLFADLTASGARNALRDRSKGLTGRRRFAAMVTALGEAAAEDNIALDLELVYGHCWGAAQKNDPGNFKIDASRIPIRRS